MQPPTQGDTRAIALRRTALFGLQTKITVCVKLLKRLHRSAWNCVIEAVETNKARLLHKHKKKIHRIYSVFWCNSHSDWPIKVKKDGPLYNLIRKYMYKLFNLIWTKLRFSVYML